MMKDSPETSDELTTAEIAAFAVAPVATIALALLQYSSMSKAFGDIEKDWEKINKKFEKNVKKITKFSVKKTVSHRVKKIQRHF